MYVRDKLDIYNDSAIILEQKTPKKIISWITILIILVSLFVVFSFIPFNIYKPYIGKINLINNKSYIILTRTQNDFPIVKYNKLYIKNKKYDYEVVILEENNIVLDVKLENSLRIQNNIVNVNILKNRTTIFKIIKNKIKKGFGV